MISASTTIGAGVTMYLRDQFTAPSMKIRKSAKNMEAELRRVSEDLMRHQRNMYAGLAFGGALAIRGMSRMVQTGADFNYTMKGVGSIVEATTKQYGDLKTMALQTGQETIFTSKDVASGMRFMAMAGQKYVDIMSNITPAANLAAATMSELGGKGGAADIMTNVMRGFNIEASRSTEIADKLTYTTLNANTNLFDLGEAMKYSAATAADLGYGLDSIAAGIAVLGNAGIQGSMAGTAIENMMRYLTIASGMFGSSKQKKALAMTGLKASDIRDSAGNVRSLVEILNKLRASTASMGTGTLQDVLTKIFGVRGKRAGSTILRNLDQYQEMLTGIGDSAGYSQRKADEMMDTLQGDIYKILNAWENFKIAFSDAVEPMVRVFLKVGTAITKGIGWFLNTPFGKILSPLIGGLIVIRTVTWGLRSAVAGVGLMIAKGTSLQKMFFSEGILGWKGMTLSAKKYYQTILSGVRTSTSSQMLGGMGPTVAPKIKGGKGVIYTPSGIMSKKKFGSTLSKPSTNIGGTLMRTGATTGILSSISRVGGIFMRFLPILGWGMILWEIADELKGIFNNTKEKPKPVTPDAELAKFLSIHTAAVARGRAEISFDEVARIFKMRDQIPNAEAQLQTTKNQNININLFGKKALSTMIEDENDKILNKELNSL